MSRNVHRALVPDHVVGHWLGTEGEGRYGELIARGASHRELHMDMVVDHVIVEVFRRGPLGRVIE